MPNQLRRYYLTLVLVVTGGLIAAVSTILNSAFSTLLGFGLAIWGTIVLLSTTQKVVKVNLVTPQIIDSALAYDSLLSRLGYEKEAILNPPRTAGENCSVRIFKVGRRGQSVILNPIGLNLAFLVERKSPSDLFITEFDMFSEFLSRIFTDEFEFAGEFSIRLEGDLVHLQVTDFLFKEMCEQIRASSESACKRHLCPICGSIACLVAKVTHKAVVFNGVTVDGHPNSLEISFRLYEMRTFDDSDQ